MVPREVQAERSQEVLYNAAETLCIGAKRYLFTRFFEEQAMAFKLSGAEDKARWAWIAAGNLAGRSPVGKNPVVLKLVVYSISFTGLRISRPPSRLRKPVSASTEPNRGSFCPESRRDRRVGGGGGGFAAASYALSKNESECVVRRLGREDWSYGE